MARTEAPTVHEFQIRENDPWYGEFVTVEGDSWFVHSHEFKAYREWAEAEASTLRTENETLRAERDAAIARAEEAEGKVEGLSATIAAWEGAFGTIQSHLQDRIAMNDPARPDAYLRIVEGSVGELPRISRQIYAATQYRSQSTQAYANRVDLENETLRAKLAQAEGEIATMRERAAVVCDQRAAHCRDAAQQWAAGSDHCPPQHDIAASMATGVEQCERAARAIRALNLTTPEPPHGD